MYVWEKYVRTYSWLLYVWEQQNTSTHFMRKTDTVSMRNEKYNTFSYSKWCMHVWEKYKTNILWRKKNILQYMYVSTVQPAEYGTYYNWDDISSDWVWYIVPRTVLCGLSTVHCTENSTLWAQYGTVTQLPSYASWGCDLLSTISLK